jgi:cytochrome c oxidase assembly factor CtaG
VIDLIGSDGAIAECEKLGGLLRAMGAEQDHIMAVFRMRARWLQQSAAMLAEDHPGDADLAGKVRSKVEEMLHTN